MLLPNLMEESFHCRDLFQLSNPQILHDIELYTYSSTIATITTPPRPQIKCDSSRLSRNMADAIGDPKDGTIQTVQSPDSSAERDVTPVEVTSKRQSRSDIFTIVSKVQACPKSSY
jgi:hypothetical protein